MQNSFQMQASEKQWNEFSKGPMKKKCKHTFSYQKKKSFKMQSILGQQKLSEFIAYKPALHAILRMFPAPNKVKLDANLNLYEGMKSAKS